MIVAFPRRLLRDLLAWASVTPARRASGVALFLIVTMTLLTGRSLYSPSALSGGHYSITFFILLYINLFLVLALGIIVVRSLVRLWLERRQRLAGARLRTRMSTLFAALSLLPTVVIAVFSVELLNRGVDSWFSDRITQALQQSIHIARAYYRESQRTVRHDAEDMVRNRRLVASTMTLQRSDRVQLLLENERQARSLDEITVLQADGTRIAVAGDLPLDAMPDLTPLVDGTLRSLLVTDDTGTWVRAFVHLGGDQFLSAGRWIDRQILSQMEQVESAFVDYQQLRAAHGLLKSSHTMTLVTITLLLLLAALWSGLRIADSLTSPITQLVLGTRKVADGDLSVTMAVTGDDELATLMAAFNAMTQKLGENRRELQATNDLLEDRRRFMAAILRHISSGVISVDREERVTLINPAAARLIGIEPQPVIGTHYRTALPEPVLQPLEDLRRSGMGRNGGGNVLSIQIRIDGAERPLTLLARMTLLGSGDGASGGFLVTFDDLTDVLMAQRSRAWSEVARRIAHEIKNPLTPIQLWAQRMRRKYLRAQEAGTPVEWQILDEGTQAIINQVEEMRVLVDEFSNFARMPRPSLRHDDLNAAIQEVLLLHDADCRGITVEKRLWPGLPTIPFDRSQIKQVLTNLVSNALVAIRERPEGPEGEIIAPRLSVTTEMAHGDQWVSIQIADSGVGIPADHRDRIFDPYFTTRKRGTGLGLAIVKKIIEDHGGALRVRDSIWQGALIEVLLPIVATPSRYHSSDAVVEE
ncbi:MAG: HAMP domain-containing protein [Magnetococcales bacterium]|nr:HAMP domain-containing protein [Magnetococcales bacterium]